MCLVYKNCTPGVLVEFANVLDGFFKSREENRDQIWFIF